MAVQLRDYQKAAIAKVKETFNEGAKSALGILPTGGGKTVVFLNLADEYVSQGKRVLVLAHRQDLIDQPVKRVELDQPHLQGKVGVVMADQNQCDAPLVVATVQTVQNPKRLKQIINHGPIDLVITDEAHHAVGDTYQEIYKFIWQYCPSMKHLGVTATPQRGDAAGLSEVFEKVAFKYSIKDMIKWGYLVPPRWLAIQTGISLSGVGKVAGDFNQKQLAKVYEVDNCFDLVVESHKKYGDGRKAIAFVTSVEGAYDLAEKFNEAGIPAAAADGTTDKMKRRQLLADFRAGKYQVLCNVALWTEGLDVPEINLVHMVRPTQSDGLYLQMMGRGLRPVPGKDDCLILDYCPVDNRNIVMAGDVLGVPAKKEAYVKESKDEGEVVGGFTYDGKNTKWLDGNPAELISRQLDYMSASPWHWTRWGRDWMVLGLGPASDGIDRTLAIGAADNQGNVRLFLIAKSTPNTKPDDKPKCNKAYMIKQGDLQTVSDYAEEYANERGNPQIIAKARKWKRESPTPEQIQFAQRLGVWRPGLNRGDVAGAITAKMAMDTIKRTYKDLR